jgi:hypothetical protein
VTYGWGGAYNRGAQSNDDTFHSSYCAAAAAAVDVAASADITFETCDRAHSSNNNMGVYASTASNRHFFGIQVLDLATLAGGGSSPQTVVVGVATTSTSALAVTATAGAQSVTVGVATTSATAVTTAAGAVSVAVRIPARRRRLLRCRRQR